MTEPNRTGDELIEEARAIAIALSLAQIGDVNAMAHEEAVAAYDLLDGDADLTYTVLRILAGAVSSFAGVFMSDVVRVEGSARHHQVTADAIRTGIASLNISGEPRPDSA